MQSTCINDVKIYNLTIGKTMPEWLSSRAKRAILKKDSQLRNRIQLLQDFTMPGVSQTIQLSPDEQFVNVTGTYKPRLRCFDTSQLAMKFERCFDSEIIKMIFLAGDYTKLAFLQNDRWLEFHNQSGRYFRLRIPKAGHDFAYHKSTCDLYVVGDGSHINRLNLEIGKFNEPLESESICLNSCAINPIHELFVAGGKEGIVEAFDHRTNKRVARLDIALNAVTQDTEVDGMPGVSCISFKDALHMAVGTETGQILLFDLRSTKPLVVKDHFYGLPIKKAVFIPQLDLMASLDEKICKLWKEKDGSPYTAIQTPHDLNDVCIIPNTGMMFFANECEKIQSFYIPNLGPAPKWASFLDRLVEEMEEEQLINGEANDKIYDDYKFVTERELITLGLDHLIGSNMLRAYMHGFFMDVRLYNKAKSLTEPFAFEEYKKKKVKEAVESEREDRVLVTVKKDVTSSTVNRDLANKLMQQTGLEDVEDPVGASGESEVDPEVNRKESKKKKAEKEVATSILKDDRFGALFQNPDFQIDEHSEEYNARQFRHRSLNRKKEKSERKTTKSVNERSSKKPPVNKQNRQKK